MSAIPLRRIEGKYEILEKIREGGMGAIYKVRHRLLDEVRVIKVMRPQLTEDEELKERFLREARLAIKLRHPNVAQLYDFTIDEETGIAFIVLELIEGTTLEDLLAVHGPPPLGLALEIAQQSLRALGYLHAKGFVHRDISPDNLMLTEDAEGAPLVKLIDLGIAKNLGAPGERMTQTGTFLGKLRYASPEQFDAEGAAQADARGDLYSFGIVLYELLTGRYPIQGRDPSSLVAGHLFRPPLDFAVTDPDGRVEPGLRAAVLRALAKSPDERFAGALELSRALAPFRQPGDVREEDVRRVLAPLPLSPTGVTARDPSLPPGSTQARLDEQFGLETTPLPRGGTVLPGAPPPPREMTATLELRPRGDAAAPDDLEDTALRWAAAAAQAGTVAQGRPAPPGQKPPADERAAALSAALSDIEAALAQGNAAEAEALLYETEATHGNRPELAALYGRLEELHQERRREQEAAEAAAAEQRRARAERRAAALAETTAALDTALRGRTAADLDEAGRLLDQAVLRFGAAPELHERWQRLEALRRALRAGGAPADPDFEAFWEASQKIAELLALRETGPALRALHDATARFGDREELQKLRKRLADIVLG